MSQPRASRRTVFVTLIALLAAGLVVTVLTVRRGHLPGTGFLNRLMRSEAATGQNPMYAGLQPVKPAVMRKLFPAERGRPFVLVFTSRFCLDCKHLKPVLEKQWEAYPGLRHQSLDVMEDRKSHAAVFSAFKPVSVPTLVLVRADGAIADVLYNPHSSADIVTAFDRLLKPPAPGKAP
ncbi:MAG: TlpA family protein disulfide reductase [Candidatus Melainabacteria bacterium]